VRRHPYPQPTAWTSDAAHRHRRPAATTLSPVATRSSTRTGRTVTSATGTATRPQPLPLDATSVRPPVAGTAARLPPCRVGPPHQSSHDAGRRQCHPALPPDYHHCPWPPLSSCRPPLTAHYHAVLLRCRREESTAPTAPPTVGIILKAREEAAAPTTPSSVKVRQICTYIFITQWIVDCGGLYLA
jgi:hypothetical protein